MTLIKELLNVPIYGGDLGLELEVESKAPLPRVRTKVWGSKREGSLRFFGMEYYTTGETPILNDEKKLQYIQFLVNKFNQDEIIQNSPRTSLHVHVNVQNHDIINVYALACAYWLFENLLIKYCGEGLRSGNYFCLRLADADAIISLLCKDIKEQSWFRSFNENEGELRYSAINFASIPKFGSVEFRAMRGTHDAHIIHQWSSELHNLVTASKHFTPSQLLDRYYYSTKEEFLSLFFSPAFSQLLTQYNNWEKCVEDNEGAVCELAYLEDWDKFNVEPKEFKRRKRFVVPPEEEEPNPEEMERILEQLHQEQLHQDDPLPNNPEWMFQEGEGNP